MTFFVFSFLPSLVFPPPAVYGTVTYWNQADGGSWSDSSWSQYSGTATGIFLGGLKDFETKVTADSLSLTQNLYVGFDDHYPNTPRVNYNPGYGYLEVTGGFTTTASVYVGQQYRDTTAAKESKVLPSDGYGKFIVSGDLKIAGSLLVGRDGAAAMTVTGDNVSIGNGKGTNFHVSLQHFQGSSDIAGYTSTEGITTVDFSGTKNVTINTDGVYLAAYSSTDSTVNHGNQRYIVAADVKFGENNTITATEMVVASSFGMNLSAYETTVDFGAGENTLNVNNFYVGYWKSENRLLTAEELEIDDRMAYLHNEVTCRLDENGEKTAIFNLGGKAEGTRANLYIGYQNIDTSNVATGTLDLSNVASANLYLDKLYIGYKTESSIGLERAGGSEGTLILSNATVDANEIHLAYKEATRIPTTGERVTRGLLEMTNSVVRTDTLKLGDVNNVNLISHAYMDMTDSTLTVDNGVEFADNINFTATNSKITIHQGTATTAVYMYADFNLQLQDSEFNINTAGETASSVEDAGHFEGYVNMVLGGDSLLKIDGNTKISRHSWVRVGDTSRYEIHGDMEFVAGDVVINEVNSDGEIINTTTKTGQITFNTVSEGSILIDGNYISRGQTLFSVNSEVTSSSIPTLEITGNAIFNSFDHEILTVEMKNRVIDPAAGVITYDRTKPIALWLERGSVKVGGDMEVTGNLTFEMNGGSFTAADVILNGTEYGVANVIFLITDGTYLVNNLQRGEVGVGITLDMKMVGGKLTANSIGAQDEPLATDARPTANLHFLGGTMVFTELGSEYTPYFLDQSVHTYEGVTDLKSYLSPGDNGKYGSTTITGNTYSEVKDDAGLIYKHTYDIRNGTIRLDLSAHARDELVVLGSMNMNDANFDIYVNGTLSLTGLDIKDGKKIGYVTLAFAEEFYTADGTDDQGKDLFTQLQGDILPDSGVANFSWMSDHTDWLYYITPVAATETRAAGYELRAFTENFHAFVPEPSTAALFVFGVSSYYIIHYRNRWKSGKNITAVHG
ncbi:MAG: hypothetical protein Q4C96_10945 [Planctomycetia bacterium]|nr:hypothetical protein [Planctomycetia bacterium]